MSKTDSARPDFKKIGEHTSVSYPSEARSRDAVPAQSAGAPDFRKIGEQAQNAEGKSIGKSDDQLRGDNQPDPHNVGTSQSDKTVNPDIHSARNLKANPDF